MSAFATIADYEARQGELAEADRTRCAALLEDASADMRSHFRARYGTDYAEGVNPSFDDNAKAVCVAVAARALIVSPMMAGVSQYSQTAGPYSSSVAYANPTGDLFIGKEDLKKLGLVGTRVGSIDAMTWTDREEGSGCS